MATFMLISLKFRGDAWSSKKMQLVDILQETLKPKVENKPDPFIEGGNDAACSLYIDKGRKTLC